MLSTVSSGGVFMGAVDYEKLYPFWRNLDANEQDMFASATRRLSYRSNTLIHQPGRKCEGMFYMLKGVLRIYILSVGFMRDRCYQFQRVHRSGD